MHEDGLHHTSIAIVTRVEEPNLLRFLRERLRELAPQALRLSPRLPSPAVRPERVLSARGCVARAGGTEALYLRHAHSGSGDALGCEGQVGLVVPSLQSARACVV